MTNDNIMDFRWGPLSSHIDVSRQEKKYPLRMVLALKLLLIICLIAALGGCVGTREGDYDTPEFAAARHPI